MKATATKKEITEVTLVLSQYEAQCLLALDGFIGGMCAKGSPRNILAEILPKVLKETGITPNENIEVSRSLYINDKRKE